jgi:hypothetical protein
MNYRKFQAQRLWLHLLTIPLIWLPLISLFLLDGLISLYQVTCFPIYKIKKVKRSTFIQVIDRNKLAYLNPLEKISCMYCGYANGFLLYAKEIAGLTEKYWCGIKHQAKPGFKPQAYQTEQNFSEFGDEADFHKKYDA